MHIIYIAEGKTVSQQPASNVGWRFRVTRMLPRVRKIGIAGFALALLAASPGVFADVVSLQLKGYTQHTVLDDGHGGYADFTVSQFVQKSHGSTPGLYAEVFVTTPTSAFTYRVVSAASTTPGGTITPAGANFTGSGSVNVSMPALALDFDVFGGVIGAETGTLHAEATLTKPQSVDNFRGATSDSYWNAFTHAWYRTRTRSSGRQGFNPSGSGSVWFDDGSTVETLVGQGSNVQSAWSTFGFFTSGEIQISK